MDAITPVPSHVPKNLIFEFDIYADPRVGEDVQGTTAAALKDAPDIFWAPANGGHWVVKRYEHMYEMSRNPEVFSVKEMQIPRIANPPRFIPLSLDPPENIPFRQVLAPVFSPKAVRDLEPKIRSWAQKLVAGVADKGECDFIYDVTAVFPIAVFMELMGLPMERLREFHELCDHYFRSVTSLEDYYADEAKILKALGEVIEDKRRNPGDDLISHLLASKVYDRPISTDELLSMCYILYLGGMDTVTNVLGFTFRQLAKDPALQERLVNEPAKIPDFVDEALRCFGVATLPRIVRKDAEVFGITFKKDDMVLGMLPISGRDDRMNGDPMAFDIDRPSNAHLTFSAGPHQCVGQGVARSEINIMTEEWLKRIPRFSLKPGEKHGFRAGTLYAIDRLPLVWGEV